MSAPTFTADGPLPPGALSIEASAGTGKTFTLAGLAARYLAEGHCRADQLLMVTFTRAATGELRSRVRERLVQAAAHLEAVIAGRVASDAADDPFLHWLASPHNRAGTLADRAAHLDLAISEFDAATITTIHGFAAQVLGALGIGAGVDGDIGFVDDTHQRIVEACTDLLAGAAASVTDKDHLPTYETYTARVRDALGSPDLRILPTAADNPPPKDLLLADLVREAVELVRWRRHVEGTQSFDDLLVRLRAALTAGGSRAALSALRDRFRVALIDEFQDTDPVQWGIFHTLFGEGAPLVLVGDPKQAIYSFRGADVLTYVQAVRGATAAPMQRRALDTNWRSNEAVLSSIERLFTGASFGDGIPFMTVHPSVRHAHERLGDRRDTVPPALQVRCAAGGLVNDPDKDLAAEAVRPAIFADLTQVAIELLDHGLLPDTLADGTSLERPVRPSDIAVLVRSNSDARAVQAMLLGSGVPAVLSRGQSVLESRAARHLTWLLEAMSRPSDQRRARTYAVSWFGGFDPAWVASAGDADIATLQDRLHEWNGVLTGKGVVEFLRSLRRESGVIARVLTEPDGDRSVTDLEHLGELLHLGLGDTTASAAGLLGVFERLRRGIEIQADTDNDTDITARRVESDSAAVQIMTVWVAKGLEFPIVMCPTMWANPNGPTDYHDPVTGVRTYDVSNGAGWPVGHRGAAKLRKALANEEKAAEAMRLLYVALTRARHHSIVWWARCRGSDKSPLARVLFARGPDGSIDPARFAGPDVKAWVPPHSEAASTLAGLLVPPGSPPDVIAVAEFGEVPVPMPEWKDPHHGGSATELAAADFTRVLDRSRSRWSFTAVVSRDRQRSDPWDLTIDDEGADDEQRPPDPDPAGEAEPGALPDTGAGTGSAGPPSNTTGESALAWLPAGAAFGTLAHDVLERVDFTADPLAEEVARVVAEQQRWRALRLRRVGDGRPADDPAAEDDGARMLTDGLMQVIHTPLGAQFAGLRLRDVPPTDRLDELDFTFNLRTDPGRSSRPADVRHVGAVLLEHLPSDDPFRGWARALAEGSIPVRLAGHLTGSIDSVVRIRFGPTGEPRYVVVDYKTNRLHAHAAPPEPGDYGPASTARSMAEHHYPLQALLYLVALHRYLRWRQPGYDPATHLGGAAYLFLRGMTGEGVRTHDGSPVAEGGRPDGVCTWAPPAAGIIAVSDLLDGGLAPTGDPKDVP